MPTRYLMVGFLSLLFTLNCNGPKAPTQGEFDMGRTVYDTGGNDDSDTLFEEEVVGDSLDYRDDPIQASELTILDSGDRSTLDGTLNWEPVHFEFDKADLSQATKDRLAYYARVLQDRPSLKVLLEGHCDTRGTEEYNLALGERRAQAVKRYFEQLGIVSSRLRTISYGELRPVDHHENEAAWAENRRVSFVF